MQVASMHIDARTVKRLNKWQTIIQIRVLSAALLRANAIRFDYCRYAENTEAIFGGKISVKMLPDDIDVGKSYLGITKPERWYFRGLQNLYPEHVYIQGDTVIFTGNMRELVKRIIHDNTLQFQTKTKNKGAE